MGERAAALGARNLRRGAVEESQGCVAMRAQRVGARRPSSRRDVRDTKLATGLALGESAPEAGPPRLSPPDVKVAARKRARATTKLYDRSQEYLPPLAATIIGSPCASFLPFSVSELVSPPRVCAPDRSGDSPARSGSVAGSKSGMARRSWGPPWIELPGVAPPRANPPDHAWWIGRDSASRGPAAPSPRSRPRLRRSGCRRRRFPSRRRAERAPRDLRARSRTPARPPKRPAPSSVTTTAYARSAERTWFPGKPFTPHSTSGWFLAARHLIPLPRTS